MRTAAVGVIVPVHDEEDLLAAALDALARACGAVTRLGVACHVAVVLDACTDRSGAIARRWGRDRRSFGVSVVEVGAGNVGHARRAGGRALLAGRRHLPAHRLWLASTDADSRVPPRWLVHQVDRHEHGAGLWAGSIVVDGTAAGRDPRHLQRWQHAYDREERPVHGASLGIRASDYLVAGGFAPLATGEDRALHAAALAAGTVACHDRHVPVVTSGRHTGRAPAGVAADLRRAAGADRVGGAASLRR